MSRYRVVFDFPHDSATFVRRKKPYNDEDGMSGMGIVQRGQRIMVHSVDNDSPASLAGVHTGDELLAINGNPLPERPGAIRKLLRSGDGKVVQLHVKDAKGERTVELTLRRRI